MSFSSKVLYSYVENINFFYADGITPGISKMFHFFSLTTIEINFFDCWFSNFYIFFLSKKVFLLFFFFFSPVLKAFNHAIINGRSLVKSSRKVFFQGCVIVYEVDDNGKEKIAIDGPVKRNLYIDVSTELFRRLQKIFSLIYRASLTSYLFIFFVSWV